MKKPQNIKNRQLEEELSSQVLEEMNFARQYKQKRVSSWQKTDQMYYSKIDVRNSEEAGIVNKNGRANVDLSRMQEFVHTLLSKIDTPLTFKFVHRKASQVKRSENLNALRRVDEEKDFWGLKDLVTKKQAIMYGRTILTYYADSINGIYKSHLEPVDVYDFLIDPTVGGIDIEKAYYMGRYGVVKNVKEIKDGVKNKTYNTTYAKEIASGVAIGNAGGDTINSIDKVIRETSSGGTNKQNDDPSKFIFWEWYTTYNGERYYVMINNDGNILYYCLLRDIFPSDLYPFWTWAYYPDLTEFWTPAPCDYVRELFMTQNVSINQLLDNAEAVNKPQKLIDVGAFENLAELKYKPGEGGVIRVKRGFNLSQSYQTISPPSINTPNLVFNILEGIQEKSSGVTAGAKGVSDERGKATIYLGNRESAAERYGTAEKSYSFGYKRFAMLYELGVREHLVKKVAIDLIGVDGIETRNVSRLDIFKGNEDFYLITESSDADDIWRAREQQAKLEFLNNNNRSGFQNPLKAYEIGARIAGFNQDEIRQLQDVNNYGTQEVVGEAERDIELLLEGNNIKPNKIANNAYKQRLVEYYKDQSENMTNSQQSNFIEYIKSIEETVISNEVRGITKYEQEIAGGAENVQIDTV